ncbi:hypothetical protein ACLBXM_06770 [Xanthobacteraceae bacterium A53D]
MTKISVILAALALSVAPAVSQVADPNMTCGDWLKLMEQAGPTPSTGNPAADKMAADMTAKMKAYCTANPTAKVTEAAMKAAGG